MIMGLLIFFTTINPQTLNSNFNLNLSHVMDKYINTPTVNFTYKGSKTTPICEQTVNWYVASNHLKLRLSLISKSNFSDKKHNLLDRKLLDEKNKEYEFRAN